MKFVFLTVIAWLAFTSLAEAQTSQTKPYEKTLYVLSIGVNESADVEPLKYADKDATAFADAIEKRKGSYPFVHKIILTEKEESTTNKVATTNNIKAILQTMAGESSACEKNNCTIQDKIKSLADKIQSSHNGKSNKLRPEDGLLIFFSGHGYRECRVVNNGDKKEEVSDSQCLNENFGNKLHLIVSNTKVESGKFTDSWTDEDFETNLAEIQAGRMAIILDSCFSGASEATSDDWRLGPLNSSGFSQLIYEKGIFILASSQKNQTSRERETLGRGIFTDALINSLPKDTKINLEEWFKKSNDNLFKIQKDPKLEPKEQICQKPENRDENQDNNRPLNPPENIRTSEMKNPDGIIAEIKKYPELNKLYEPYRNSSADDEQTKKVSLARFFTDKFFNYSNEKNINLCQEKWTDAAFDQQFSELKKCESVFCRNRIILQELLKGENNLSGQDKDGKIISLDLLQEPKFLFYKREQIDPTKWNF